MPSTQLPIHGSTPSARVSTDVSVVVTTMLKGGLSILLRGFEYSRDLGVSRWEFAVASEALCRAGLSSIDLHWLLARGYVEVAPSIEPSDGPDKRFRRRAFHEKDTDFTLTNAGAVFAFEVISGPIPTDPQTPSPTARAKGIVDDSRPIDMESSLRKNRPKWDSSQKELRFGVWTVKHFRWSAANQEAILMAFEEEGWPVRIDDPLPPKRDQDPKQRLHDTIKCLNRNHQRRLIRFLGDGTGEGIRWVSSDYADADWQ